MTDPATVNVQLDQQLLTQKRQAKMGALQDEVLLLETAVSQAYQLLSAAQVREADLQRRVGELEARLESREKSTTAEEPQP